jgi:UDP-3-O-[3-hydroxymyristoyl] glucosamine N-acyltransferase
MSQQQITASALAERLGGTLLDCPPDRLITEVLPLEEAKPSSVSFMANAKYLAKAKESGAGLLIVSPKDELEGRARITMGNPYFGFAQAVGILHPEPEPEWTDTLIHPTAQIDPTARIAPGASIGARTIIGARCIIHPGVNIGTDSVLGEDCVIYSGVSLYRRTILGKRVRIHSNSVLGSDGFGYATSGGIHHKIPQAGWVETGDDVEIGACVTIDRGALGATYIGNGTKVDNLCQIAHGVRTDEHCLIVSQTGISGSTTLGHHVTLAGKVGVVGHIHIGSNTTVGGNSVVAKPLPEGSFVTGYPARPHKQWMETQAALNRLPGLMKKLNRSGSNE